MITRILITIGLVILVLWGVIKFFTWIGQEDEIAVPVQVTNVEQIAQAVNDERDERDQANSGNGNDIVIDEGTTTDGSTTSQTESYSGTVPEGQGLIIVGEKITGTVGSTGTQVDGDQGVFIALPPGATYDVQVTNGQVSQVSEGELQERFCGCVNSNLDTWPNARVFKPAEWTCKDN